MADPSASLRLRPPALNEFVENGTQFFVGNAEYFIDDATADSWLAMKPAMPSAVTLLRRARSLKRPPLPSVRIFFGLRKPFDTKGAFIALSTELTLA